MAVPASAVRTTRAWLLEVASGTRLAAGAPFVVEYLLESETIPVPRTPRHCPGVMLWRERMIPVVDLLPVLSGSRPPSGDWSRSVVLAWQKAPGAPLQYGALRVCAPPLEVFTADDMACSLPDDLPLMRHLARSCFRYESSAIPVLDVARLFGAPLPEDLREAAARAQEATPDGNSDQDDAAIPADGAGATMALPLVALEGSAALDRDVAEAVPRESDEQALAGYVHATAEPVLFEVTIDTTGLAATPEPEETAATPVHAVMRADGEELAPSPAMEFAGATYTDALQSAAPAGAGEPASSTFSRSLARHQQRTSDPILGRDRFRGVLVGVALVGLALLIVIGVLFAHVRDTNSRKQEAQAIGPGSTETIAAPSVPVQPPR